MRQALLRLLREDGDDQEYLHTVDPEVLLSAAAAEGIVAQVYRSLIQIDAPRALLETFRGAAVSQAGSALMLRRERERVLSALPALSPIILKGEVYARSFYPEYPDRPMGDLDLLVQERDFAATESVLLGLGYSKSAANQGSLVMPQRSYRLAITDNVISVIDVHTGLFNRPAMGSLLDYLQLARDGQAIRGLPKGITTPSRPHLMVHAALHLLGHHGHEQRLIWLLDIHLLTNNLDQADVDSLMAYCHQHGLSAALSRVIEEVQAVFPSDDRTLLEALQRQAAIEQDDALDPLRFLGRSPLQQAMDDWHALAGLNRKLNWLRQHLFPRAEYMKMHYSLCRTWSLPFFYLWRIVRGAVKLLRPR